MAIGVLISVSAFLVWKEFVSPERSDSLELENRDSDSTGILTVSELNGSLTAAWNTIEGDERDEIDKVNLLIESATDSWQRNGIGVLDGIWNSLADANVRNIVLRSVLIKATQRSGHQATFDQAMELRGGARDWTLRKIVESWLREDPLQTLKAVSSVTIPRIQKGLQYVVATEWAQLAPNDLLNSLDQLPRNVRWIGEDEAMLTIARNAPVDALRFLEDPFNIRESMRENLLAQEIANSWSEIDIDAAFDWAMTKEFSDRQTQFDVVSVVLRKLARINHEDAMKRIKKRFGDDLIGSGLKLVIIDEVASHDREAAIQLLDKENSYLAHFQVGRRFLKNHDYDGALEVGIRLAGDQQQTYFASTFSFWAESSPFSLLDSLEGLPSDEIKSLAAFNLVQHYLNRRSLKQEQVQFASSFLSDEHSQQIVATYGPDNLERRTNFRFNSTMDINLPSEFGADTDISRQVAELFRRQVVNL